MKNIFHSLNGKRNTIHLLLISLLCLLLILPSSDAANPICFIPPPPPPTTSVPPDTSLPPTTSPITNGYSCQPATQNVQLTNGTIVTLPVLSNCRNYMATNVCTRYTNLFNINYFIGEQLSYYNNTSLYPASCANAMQDWLCYLYFPPCSPYNNSVYQQLCYSTCLSLLGDCWPTLNSTVNATCYNLAYQGLSYGGPNSPTTYPVAQIGDANCTASFTPLPEPYPKRKVPWLITDDGSPIERIRARQDIQDALNPLTDRTPGVPISPVNRNIKKKPDLPQAYEKKLKELEATKKIRGLMRAITKEEDLAIREQTCRLLADEYPRQCRYPGKLFYSPIWQNIVITNCNNSATNIYHTIILYVNPAKGFITVDGVPTFTGSDDTAERENFYSIQAFCPANNLNITNNTVIPSPPAISYTVICATSNVTQYNITVYAAIGSALGYVYVNNKLNFEGQTSDATLTAMETGTLAVQSFCSFINTAVGTGTTTINGYSGNIVIDTITLFVSSPAANTIEIDGVGELCANSPSPASNCLLGIISLTSDGNILWTKTGAAMEASLQSWILNAETASSGQLAVATGSGPTYYNWATPSTFLVTSLIAGTNIGVSSAHGSITVTNTAPSQSTVAGDGISVSCSTGVCTINSTTGTLESTDSSIIISNPSPGKTNLQVHGYSLRDRNVVQQMSAGGTSQPYVSFDFTGHFCGEIETTFTPTIQCASVTLCIIPFQITVGGSNAIIQSLQTIDNWFPSWAQPSASDIANISPNMPAYSQSGSATKIASVWVIGDNKLYITQPTGPGGLYWSSGDTITWGGAINPLTTTTLATTNYACFDYDTNWDIA